MPIKLTVIATGSGTCALTGKENCDGLVCSFEDGTLREAHLSWKAFRQLLGLKVGQIKLPVAAVPVKNGTP